MRNFGASLMFYLICECYSSTAAAQHSSKATGCSSCFNAGRNSNRHEKFFRILSHDKMGAPPNFVVLLPSLAAALSCCLLWLLTHAAFSDSFRPLTDRCLQHATQYKWVRVLLWTFFQVSSIFEIGFSNFRLNLLLRFFCRLNIPLRIISTPSSSSFRLCLTFCEFLKSHMESRFKQTHQNS